MASTGLRAFTRFVLPFSYSLEREAGWEGPVYQQIAAQDFPGIAERRPYLTPETANTLFARASWFQLSHSGGVVVAQTLKCSYTPNPESLPGVPFEVALSEPQVVLFEAPTAASDPETDGQPDPLHIGLLLIDADFATGADLTIDAVLEFNEHFRCLWPLFDGHAERYRRCVNGYRLAGGDVVEALSDCEAYFDRWAELLSFPVMTSDGWVARLQPTEWTQSARGWLSGQTSTSDESAAGWLLYPDNRAFVWTGVQTEGGVSGLPAPDGVPGRWVKLLNVDRPSKTGNDGATPFEVEWAKARTYERWRHLGSLYGFSAHSGVMLASTPPADDPPVLKHFRNHYFDLALVLLYVRAATFGFSQQLATLSARARAGVVVPAVELARRFAHLRRDFMLLTNLYRYPLLSSQQQAVEMYALARKYLDVEDLFTEVDKKLAVTEEHFSARREQELADRTMELTKVATLGLGLSLGIAINEVLADRTSPEVSIVTWSIAFVIGLAIVGGAFRRWRRGQWAMMAGLAVAVIVIARVEGVSAFVFLALALLCFLIMALWRKGAGS